ncbi:MAG TPA: PP2C family protein-serine/threonine phosphatase [Thermoanaerobaculia bacterium]|nr:PP2C family protein-serine/threonine phosphatase [Thermoanaerobaculia bacterium]
MTSSRPLDFAVGEAADYRRLIAEVDRVLATIEAAEDDAPTVQRMADALTLSLGAELGVTGGRIYVREGEQYRLWTVFGDSPETARGIVVPRSYDPLRRVLAEGTVFVEEDHPALDRALEERLGTRGFAAIEVGDGEFVLAFDLHPERRREQALFGLGLLRHGIDQRIRRERFEDVLRQARRIHSSILPQQMPRFGDFEISARSVPLDRVGGDFYDFLPHADTILGLAIADVSGHGLPAALQVRDIYTGLRMGTAREYKIVRTVERLNQIIHLSRGTGRFVSMVYGELEIDGTFIYVNAGHPAPFHLSAKGGVRRLERGGAVLGPLPNAAYTRGYLTLEPGDLLVLFTDGVIETHRARGANGTVAAPVDERWGPLGEEYGDERLIEVVRRHRQEGAEAIVDAIFADVAAFESGASPTDDRTAVVVKHRIGL